MTNRNAPAPASPRSRPLAAVAWTSAAAIALALATSPLAFAQQPATPPAAAPAAPAPAAKPKPAPAPAPAKKPAAAAPAKPGAAPPAAQVPAPGPQDQAQGQAQQAPKFVYTPWVKVCRKDEAGAADKQICFTGTDARLETGMVVGNLVLVELEGDQKKSLLRISVPIAVQLPPGTRVVLDQGKDAGDIMTGAYRYCGPNEPLCSADFEATPEIVAKLKKAQIITLQAMGLNGQVLSIPLPMAEFTKAYEGPATDPKVFQAQQEKLQEGLQKQADEARKRLEAQQGAAAQPAAPAAGKTQ